jgi:fatty acid-binding protein DegV
MPRAVGFYKKDGKTRPITKGKPKSKFHGQTSESSWKKSSLRELRKGNITVHQANNEVAANRIANQLKDDGWENVRITKMKEHPGYIVSGSIPED